MTSSSMHVIPSVTEIIKNITSKLPKALFVLWTREILSNLRKQLKSHTISGSRNEIMERVFRAVLQKEKDFLAQLSPVINATGVVLHTGLGRAPIGNQTLSEVQTNLQNFLALEINSQGKRGERYDPVRDLFKVLTGAEDILVVNNNAAAVLLVLNSLAQGRQVVISRGEEVEIGGSFRIPDVIYKSGCQMVEVGTTNRTHLRDFEQAVSKDTAVFLQVHTSNYRVKGFTKHVEISKLVALGKKYRILVVSDLGSGALIDLEKFGFASEPLVRDVLKTGVSIVTFSGDKLLGGPQCGIIAGKKRLISKIKKNTLLRALRPDKFTLSILRNVLLKIASEKVNELPTYKLLSASITELKKRADSILLALTPRTRKNLQIKIEKTAGQFGSGSMPTREFESLSIVIKSNKESARSIFQTFLSGEPRLLGRIFGQRVFLDLRTVFIEQDKELIQSIKRLSE